MSISSFIYAFGYLRKLVTFGCIWSVKTVALVNVEISAGFWCSCSVLVSGFASRKQGGLLRRALKFWQLLQTRHSASPPAVGISTALSRLFFRTFPEQDGQHRSGLPVRPRYMLLQPATFRGGSLTVIAALGLSAFLSRSPAPHSGEQHLPCTAAAFLFRSPEGSGSAVLLADRWAFSQAACLAKFK